MIFVGLEMDEMISANPDGLRDRRFLHVHVKRVQHQFDRRMVHCIKKLYGLLCRTQHITFEAIERFNGKQDTHFCRVNARFL